MEKNCIMRQLFIFIIYFQDNQKKEDEMGRTCSTYGGVNIKF
jgi:hypothetical protein